MQKHHTLRNESVLQQSPSTSLKREKDSRLFDSSLKKSHVLN
jgi:hypothetical protein